MKLNRSAGRCSAALAAVILSATCTLASAAGGLTEGYPDNWQALDPREVQLLPDYCKYTQIYRSVVQAGNNRAQIQRWTAIMGPTFNSMHHYCNGLLKTNRAILLATNEQTRKFYLDSSLGEFDYVINRAPANFVLLPEILTKKGENLLRLGREIPALETLKRSMAIKPDYWPAYTVLADYYKEHGNVAQARAVLENALEHSPDAQAVKRRLAELGSARASK
jgi:tetratricopeptide (TPR) repeat protein